MLCTYKNKCNKNLPFALLLPEFVGVCCVGSGAKLSTEALLILPYNCCAALQPGVPTESLPLLHGVWRDSVLGFGQQESQEARQQGDKAEDEDWSGGTQRSNLSDQEGGQDGANPGEEITEAEPSVPHDGGEELGGELEHHGEGGGDHQLSHLGEDGLDELAGDDRSEKEAEAAQDHEGGDGQSPAQVEEGEDGYGVCEELQGGADEDVDVKIAREQLARVQGEAEVYEVVSEPNI